MKPGDSGVTRTTSSSPGNVGLFVGFVGLVATGLFASSAVAEGVPDIERVLLLALVLGVAESLEVVYHQRGQRSSYGLGDAVLPVMFLWLNLPATMLANALAIAGVMLYGRVAAIKVVFNTAQIAVAAWLSWQTFDLLRGDAEVLSIQSAVAVATALAAYSICSHTFTASVIWLNSRTPLFYLLFSNFGFLAAHFVTTLSLGALFGLASMGAWWVPVLFLPMLLVLSRGFTALLREASYAKRLEHLNEALHHLAAATELEETYVPVLQAAAGATASDRAILVLDTPEGPRTWQVSAGSPGGASPAPEHEADLKALSELDPGRGSAPDLPIDGSGPMTAPVKHGERVLGVMAVMDRTGPGQYESGDLQLLEALAAELASTILSEETRERLQRELDEARMLESLGRLTGGIAHDFNNLLAIVITYSEMLLEDTGGSDERRTDLEVINDAGHRGARLVRQLLTFSRKDVVKPELIEVPAALGELLDLLRRAAGDGVELKVVIEDGIPPIQIDPVGLEQIMMNLVVNARDAMDGAGTIEVGAARSGEEVLITVSDDGHGMNADTIERVFEPFFTTKGRAAGSGLGLSTVYGIVKQAAGEISVDSVAGAGTTFRIRFPAVVGAGASEG